MMGRIPARCRNIAVTGPAMPQPMIRAFLSVVVICSLLPMRFSCPKVKVNTVVYQYC